MKISTKKHLLSERRELGVGVGRRERAKINKEGVWFNQMAPVSSVFLIKTQLSLDTTVYFFF